MEPALKAPSLPAVQHEPPFQAAAKCVVSAEQVRSHLRSKFRLACKSALQRRRQVFLEIFAGHDVLSRCLRKQGFGVVTLDSRAGPLEGVSSPAVLSTFKGWISGGAVRGIWPGAHVKAFIWSSWADRQALKGSTIRELHLGVLVTNCSSLHCCSGPLLYQNPRSSRLFSAPALVRLRRLEFISDYCQHGAPWRKSTKVIGWWNLVEFFRGTLQKVLWHKACSRSGRPHVHLAGRSPQGVSWTVGP